MSIAELSVIYNVAVIILDDQPEFRACSVLIVYFENKAIIANALIGNRDLGFVIEGNFLEPPPFALLVSGLPKRNNTAVRATAITLTVWFFVFVFIIYFF